MTHLPDHARGEPGPSGDDATNTEHLSATTNDTEALHNKVRLEYYGLRPSPRGVPSSASDLLMSRLMQRPRARVADRHHSLRQDM
jgi:hypothetical protein